MDFRSVLVSQPMQPLRHRCDPSLLQQKITRLVVADHPFTASRVSRVAQSARRSTALQKPLLTRAQQPLRFNHASQEGQQDADAQEEIPSIVDQLWERYKPPTRSLRARDNERAPTVRRNSQKKRHRRRRLYSGQCRRTKPLEFYFPSHDREEPVWEEDASFTSSLSSDASSSLDLEEDNSKRPRLKRSDSPVSNAVNEPDRIPRARRLRGRSDRRRFVDEDVCMSGTSSIDLEDEKLYGPPPGGRKVELKGVEHNAGTKLLHGITLSNCLQI